MQKTSKTRACRLWFSLFGVALYFVSSGTQTSALASSGPDVIYNFENVKKGYMFWSGTGVLPSMDGSFYGFANGRSDTSSYIIAYQLSPPPEHGSKWQYNILGETARRAWTKDGNGLLADSSPVMDSAGNLYGTDLTGGKCNIGSVFKFMNPGNGYTGAWPATVIHSFTGAGGGNGCQEYTKDGYFPQGGLLIDANGNLFGTTENIGGGNLVPRGTVYQLSPPAQQGDEWKETILYFFPKDGSMGANPTGGLVEGKNGELYGTTFGGGDLNCKPGGAGNFPGCGVVFELLPPSEKVKTWTFEKLYEFHGHDGNGPSSTLHMDANGNLYGTTIYGGANKAGAAFELSPPAKEGGNWTESVIYSFYSYYTDGIFPVQTPLIADTSDNLYGTTQGGGLGGPDGLLGTVYELSPPSQKGGTWTETTLYDFLGAPNDGAVPTGPVVFGSNNGDAAVFGTTASGGSNGNGVIFAVPTAVKH